MLNEFRAFQAAGILSNGGLLSSLCENFPYLHVVNLGKIHLLPFFPKGRLVSMWNTNTLRAHQARWEIGKSHRAHDEQSCSRSSFAF